MTQDANKPALPGRSAFGLSIAGLDDFQKEMNKMFDRFFHRDPFLHVGLPSRLKGFDLSPTVDVREHANNYAVTVELPGVSEKDVSVTVADNMLTISGEKKAEKIEDAKNVHISERHYGSFQRQFSLPDDADPAATSAEFKNGVLSVVIGRTKKPKENARQIAIKTG